MEELNICIHEVKEKSRKIVYDDNNCNNYPKELKTILHKLTNLITLTSSYIIDCLLLRFKEKFMNINVYYEINEKLCNEIENKMNELSK